MLVTKRRVVQEEVAQYVSNDYLERKKKEPYEPMMKYEQDQDRLDSFSESRDVYFKKRIAKAGFYCSPGGRSIGFSTRQRKRWTLFGKEHDPETVYGSERPNSKFITGQCDIVPILNKNPTARLVEDKHLTGKGNIQAIKDSKKNTDSNITKNQKQDADKKTNEYSTKPRPFSVQAREQDISPATHEQQSHPEISAASNTGSLNSDRSVKVSVSKSFSYCSVVLEKIVAFA